MSLPKIKFPAIQRSQLTGFTLQYLYNVGSCVYDKGFAETNVKAVAKRKLLRSDAYHLGQIHRKWPVDLSHW